MGSTSDNDYLDGGVGTDVLWGGSGADQLHGGDNNDVFDYNAIADSLPTAQDYIDDFQTGDLINLADIDANTLVSGNQAFTFVGTAAFGGVAGQLRFDDGIHFVEGDINGDAVADFTIACNTSSMAATDFVL